MTNENIAINTVIVAPAPVTKVSADKFNQQCDWVYHTRASVQSSRNWEVASEIASLISACETLLGMSLKRKSADLEARRVKAIEAARETIANNVRRATSSPFTDSMSIDDMQGALDARNVEERAARRAWANEWPAARS